MSYRRDRRDAAKHLRQCARSLRRIRWCVLAEMLEQVAAELESFAKREVK